MEEKQIAKRRRFQRPKLTRYGRLGRITMASVSTFGGSGTVSDGHANDFFGGQ
jgi:hypothetical protein